MDVTYDSHAKLIDNRRFIITINREQAYRRYQLHYADDYKCIGGPLSPEDFAKTHGFECEWPHTKANR